MSEEQGNIVIGLLVISILIPVAIEIVAIYSAGKVVSSNS